MTSILAIYIYYSENYHFDTFMSDFKTDLLIIKQMDVNN